MIRVVVVDDQPLIRAAIAMLINAEKDITVVAEAAHGEQALMQIRAERPDVVLMDVDIPGTNSATATRVMIDECLTAQNSQLVGIIILTTYRIDEAVYAALRAGASGFLLKDAVPAEIVSAIRAVVAGEVWLDPAVIGRLIDEFIALA